MLVEKIQKHQTTAVLVAMAISLSACQTSTDTTTETINKTVLTEDITNPPSHMRKLLDRGEVDDAIKYYRGWRTYFRQDTVVRTQLVQRVGKAYAGRLAQELESANDQVEAISWPAPRPSWSEIKAAFEAAERVLNKKAEFPELTVYGPVEAKRNELRETVGRWRERFEASARAAFETYPLGTVDNFFSSYPVGLDPQAFVEENRRTWNSHLASADLKTLAHIYGVYRDDLPGDELDNIIHRYHRGAVTADIHPHLPRPLKTLDALLQTAEAGLDITNLAERRATVLLPDTWPTDTTSERPFGTDLVVDIPLQIHRGVSDDQPPQSGIVIAVRPGPVRLDGQTLASFVVPSTYVSEKQETPNPAYEIALERVRAAEESLGGISGGAPPSGAYVPVDRTYPVQSAAGGIVGALVAGLIIQGIKEHRKDNLEAAREELEVTPRTIVRETYQPYEISRSCVHRRKRTAFAVTIIDFENGQYWQQDVEVDRGKRFTLVRDMHEADRFRDSHLRHAVTQPDVDRFSGETVSVPLSTLIRQVLDDNPSPAPLTADVDLAGLLVDTRGSLTLTAGSIGIESTAASFEPNADMPDPEEYVAIREAAIHSAPDTCASVSASLPTETRIAAAGQDADSSWMLVFRDEKPIGYVYRAYLKTPAELSVADDGGSNAGAADAEKSAALARLAGRWRGTSVQCGTTRTTYTGYPREIEVDLKVEAGAVEVTFYENSARSRWDHKQDADVSDAGAITATSEWFEIQLYLQRAANGELKGVVKDGLTGNAKDCAITMTRDFS